MDILVIGASGFLSGTFARLALAEGHRVWGVTRGQRAVPMGVTAITADRKDRQAFAAAVAGAKMTWDLAVDFVGYEPADARQDVEVLRGRAKHMVFISTDFVFDPEGRTFPQRDDNPHFLKNDTYGAKKRLCELEFINGDTGAMTWTVFRPCHIYGPGSQLGCLPLPIRDPELLRKMKAGDVLALVGNGHFLQQPIFAADLARLALASPSCPASHGQLFISYGPDIVESREYFRIIAELLGVELRTSEIPVTQYMAEHPEHRSFFCHRICDLGGMRAAGLPAPATSIRDGLRAHVEAVRSAQRA